MWNCGDTIQHSIPFEFKIKLPPPRLRRNIVERDYLGRIIHSQVNVYMTAKLAYGYLDESPSLHDEAIFFCIGVILTEEQNSKPFANIFKKARKTLKRKKIIVPEVKFSRSIDKVRKQVLEAIIKQGVKIVVLAFQT